MSFLPNPKPSSHHIAVDHLLSACRLLLPPNHILCAVYSLWQYPAFWKKHLRPPVYLLSSASSTGPPIQYHIQHPRHFQTMMMMRPFLEPTCPPFAEPCILDHARAFHQRYWQRNQRVRQQILLACVRGHCLFHWTARVSRARLRYEYWWHPRWQRCGPSFRHFPHTNESMVARMPLPCQLQSRECGDPVPVPCIRHLSVEKGLLHTPSTNGTASDHELFLLFPVAVQR
mmetsp:Transcript_22963/g.56584  ORF Transcript_22963/g.56584 Transcript_22963/m.56584 type:complete len:229 (+) Transcript_22963:424-1110(+)